MIFQKCNYIYTTRSELEHDLKTKVEGRIVFKKRSTKVLKRAYDSANRHLIDIFNILGDVAVLIEKVNYKSLIK